MVVKPYFYSQSRQGPKPEEEASSQLVARQMRAAVLGEVALKLANEVIEACAKHDILLMPLKGALLLARWPGLRGQRDLIDIDLLGRPADLPAVSSILREIGFEATVHSSAGSTFVSDAWPLSIDMHCRLFPHGLFRVPTEALFSRAELDSSLFAAPVARMSDEDLFAHLIGHFVKGRGTFRRDRSLDDIRWLSSQDFFQTVETDALASHLRSLGLQRAAGYVLGHPSFSDEPVAQEILRSLELDSLDQAALAVARRGTAINRDTPLWWTPHLLDRSFVAGARSLIVHADEGLLRFTRFLAERTSALRRKSLVTEPPQ